MRIKWRCLATGLVLWGLMAAPVCLAADAPRALMVPPAKDCAVVADFSGFKNVKTDSYLRKTELNEGLVIRGSKVENGKVIIPASGLYYTTRTPKSGVMQGDKVLLLGRLFHYVDNGVRLDVISNVTVPKGGSAPIGSDGSKVLALTKVEMGANGFPAANATFQILKPSGNYYGVAFPVESDAKFRLVNQGVLNKGTGRATGSYLPGVDGQNFQVEYYGEPIAISGQSYLVAEEAGPKATKIKEFGTGAANWIALTDKDPAKGMLAAGQSLKGGDYEVKVLEVNANAARISLINTKTGQSVGKTLGPLTTEMLGYLPVDEVNREKLVLRAADGRAEVQLNIYQEGQAFAGNKVRLDLFYDVFRLDNPDAWHYDQRFVFRPDT
ncbi:MAG: hypothetical protein V1797_05170 [Pseudomonadota bacterium]